MAPARGPARAADRRPPRRDGGQRYRADPARRVAYDLLAAVADRDAYANLLLPRLLAERGISGRDAALATELAYGTLRGQGTYDAVLATCSDRSLDRLDPPVLHVLRMGAHQLLATRIGTHAAVATSVDLAKDVAGPGAAGYVNAVLRRVATRDLEQWLPIAAPSPDDDRDGYLAARYSYQRWIVAAYRGALAHHGASEAEVEAEMEAALAAGNERPRVTLAIRPGAADRAELLPAGAEPTRWSPYGFTLAGGDPAALIADGVAAVQDEASQLAAIALAQAPVTPSAGLAPDRGALPPRARGWLDMCAGPGGKARMLAALAAVGGVRLVAAEVHPHRARMVASAVDDRVGVVIADGRHPAWRPDSFERVLLDVPCTGLGALRRRPEARWRKSPDSLASLGQLQRKLLRSALAAVQPGGVVAYVTCSPAPAETSAVVLDVTGASGAGVEILDAPALLPDVPDLAAATDSRFAQFWPQRHGTDAIFIALLRRAS